MMFDSLFVPTGFGGFLPAMKQIGNVAALPGIVHVSIWFVVDTFNICVYSKDYDEMRLAAGFYSVLFK